MLSARFVSLLILLLHFFLFRLEVFFLHLLLNASSIWESTIYIAAIMISGCALVLLFVLLWLLFLPDICINGVLIGYESLIRASLCSTHSVIRLESALGALLAHNFPPYLGLSCRGVHTFPLLLLIWVLMLRWKIDELEVTDGLIGRFYQAWFWIFRQLVLSWIWGFSLVIT